MAKELSKDYTSFIVNNKISDEITPILSTTENIQTRISEIDSIFLPPIRHDTEISHQNLTQILDFQPQFDKLCDQIDSLESMIERIKYDLNVVQKQVDVAEEELDIPERKIDILMKSLNIFARPRDFSQTNWNDDGFYEAPTIFNADSFFKQNQENCKEDP